MTNTDKPDRDKQIEDIMDSNDLFDLDMPLDDPENNQDDALTAPLDDILKDDVPKDDVQENDSMDIATPASELETTDFSSSLQHLMDEFPDNTPPDSEEKTSAEEIPETTLTVEKDIEHLLDRDSPEGETADEQASQTTDLNEDAENSVAVESPEVESTQELHATEIPSEKNPEKPRAGMANSIMLTLALIAILIAAVAAWLGLDASQHQSGLATASSNLEQQIKTLQQQQQQQQQQNSAQAQKIETLEKQLNALTQVVANKTTAQWRSSIKQQPAPHSAKTKALRSEATTPEPQQTNKPATPKSTIRVNKPVVTKEPARAKKILITPATTANPSISVKPVVKYSTAPTELSRYEVAPGAVKGWVVNIYSVGSKKTAERRVRQLKAKNIDSTYVRVQVNGKTWYRVRASGFKDEKAAVTFKKFLKEFHGIDAWHNYLK